MLFSARIKELESLLATVTTERDEAVTANAQCQERYTADQGIIAALTTERDAAVTALATANASLASVSAELETTKAGVQTQVVAQIAAAGADPIARTPETASTSAKGGDLLAQYEALTSPKAKTEFYRKNKAALQAEHRAKRA